MELYYLFLGVITMRIMVIYNDTSGKNEGREIAERFQRLAIEKGVEKIVLQVTNADVNEDNIREKAEAAKIDTLVIIGGDGTVHHVIRMFKEQLPHLKVGLIPGGTVNNLARVLEIPLNQEQASTTIFTENTRQIDFATLNDEVMISTMTVGILADTASKVTQEEKQKFGPFAFMRRFFRLLFKQRTYPVSVQTDTENWEGEMHLLTINMTNSVGGFTNFDPLAAVYDGLMHFTIIPKLRRWKFIRNIPRLSRQDYVKVHNVVHFSAKKALIKSLTTEKKIATRTDGDPTDDLPVKLEVIQQRIQMIIP